MVRPLSHDSEVFCRLDESRAEHLIPHSVDCDSRRQRIVGTYRPPGQGEAVSWLVCRQGRQEVRRVGLDTFSACAINTARQNMCISERWFLPGNEGQVSALGELLEFGIQMRD